MRNLQEYLEICKEELFNIGIEYGNIIEIKANSRARKRWGQCKGIPGGYSININVALLDERNDEQGLKETIIHELLHSCKGCMNHGENWKRLADKVNRYYGYHIKRCSSSDEKGVLSETRQPVRIPEYRYAVQCSCCGAIIKRQKISKVISHPSYFRCGRCNGNLVRIA